jgi:ParB family transcriptional regulator, chromosome partitioning protein
MAQNYGLGRGLSSLIPQKRPPSRATDDTPTQPSSSERKIVEPRGDFNYFQGNKPMAAVPAESQNGVQEIEISKISPNPHQPRLKFDETKLQELSDSIKAHGIIQPLTVSQRNGLYEIIAGERRFQAAKLAGLTKVPALIRDVNEQQKLLLAIVENIQRHDLNAIEEAKSYMKLMDEFDLTQEEVAAKLGKSRSSVANKLRLLQLPIEIQKGLMEGKITEGHAKAILAIENPEKQRALYEMIIKNSLTVRQTEDKTKEVSVRTHTRTAQSDPHTKETEELLSQTLGTKVRLLKTGGGGKILIEYYSSEELESIVNKFK